MKTDYSDKRLEYRQLIEKECVLSNEFDSIETQTVDMSKMGFGVKFFRTLPFKNGAGLSVFIPSMDKLYLAKLMWTKKDFDNTTRAGLKLLSDYANFPSLL